MDRIIQDFEHILKVREYYLAKDKVRHDLAYAKVKESLGREYLDNIDEKLVRWIKATAAEHYYDVKPVEYFIQAKMLFRDGFFEACIAMTRLTCELICYELLKTISHPFGNQQELEQISYRVLLKYLAFPKVLSEQSYNKIIDKIKDPDEKNFFKSSFSKKGNDYHFKIANGTTAKNLNRLFDCLSLSKYKKYDCFPNDTFSILNSVYDMGSDYLHARSSGQLEDDCFSCLNNIGFVVYTLYGIKSIHEMIGKTIQTAYSRFPKICNGDNLMIDVFPSPQAAIKGANYEI